MDKSHKVCKRCRESISLVDGFHRSTKARDGLQSQCKKCASRYAATYYENHKEKIKETTRQWQAANPEKFKESCIKSNQRYSSKHPEKAREATRQYRANNREKCREDARKCYASNPEKRREHSRKHRSKNPQYYKDYAAARRKSDMQFRLRRNLRGRLSDALKCRTKAGSAIRDLGCTVAELIEKFEFQFETGMTWANYGGRPGHWNIDHIMPLAAFDLTNRQHVLLACHHSNLRPMWHLENIAKGNRNTWKTEQHISIAA